jgi:hypothetical protein
MRSSSFARVVIASLGVSVVITLGCGKSPGRPSPQAPFYGQSISPTEGSSVGATVARIEGDRFQSGDTVTLTAAASTRRSSARLPSVSRCLLTLLEKWT